MCQINLTSIQGQSTNGINATTVIITGTADVVCRSVKLEVTACGLTHNATEPVTNGNWQHTFQGDCICGGDVKFSAVCCDVNGNPIPGCNVISFQQVINCPPVDCCPTVQIIPTIEDCNADNERKVSFVVNINVAPNQSSCLPYVVQLNFGDGNSWPAWAITAVGNHSFPATHNYNANVAGSYHPFLFYALPGNLNTACPLASVKLDLDSCAANCCPQITSASVNVGNECNDNCERLVELTVAFAPPAGVCQSAALEWVIAGQNNFSTNGVAFSTSAASPQTQSFWLSHANSPYIATLHVVAPDGCATVTREIIVGECQTPAACPEITNFGYSIGKCVAVGDDCCKEVSFTFDINVHLGCGGGPKPRVRIIYGDGDADEVQFSAGGPHGVTFTHRYCQAGDYLVRLETLYPPGCPDQMLVASVPKCDPAECKTTDGNGGKFCPCCIGLLILVTSFYWLWTMGYYQGNLVIFSINLGPKGGFASAILFFLVSLLITFCYKLVKSCKKCWLCRFYKCLFWALIVSIVMIIVMAIIAYIYGYSLPGWFFALLNAIMALWAVYLLMQTEPCKTFYSTGKCKE